MISVQVTRINAPRAEYSLCEEATVNDLALAANLDPDSYAIKVNGSNADSDRELVDGDNVFFGPKAVKGGSLR